jgi:hypothetical protein
MDVNIIMDGINISLLKTFVLFFKKHLYILNMILYYLGDIHITISVE